MDDLEQMVRDALDRRADDAVVDPQLVGRAQADARRRRTSMWMAAGAAAAVVVAAGGVAVATRDDAAPAPRVADGSTAATDPSTDPSTASVATPTRSEYWRGVEAQVPDDWALGNTGDCGDLPRLTPYVGRPIGVTDACGGFEPDATPTAPYLWFDADGVDVGVDDLGDGWVRETREVDGVRVSVASLDRAQVDRLLEAVAPGTLCPASIDAVPDPRYESTVEGVGELLGGHLCAYQGRAATGFELVHAAKFGPAMVARTEDAVSRAPVPEPCRQDSYEVVVLTGVYDDAYGAADLHRDVVYDLTCGVVRLGAAHGLSPRSFRAHHVTEATVPWAGPEFRRLLTGPFDEWAYGRFIGVQG